MRKLIAVVGALVVLAACNPTPIGQANYPPPSGAKWASASGSGSACTQASPCTLDTAVDQVPTDGTVVMKAGVYRETVDQSKPFTLQNAPGEAAWFDGSDPIVGGWIADGPRWRHAWTFNPDGSCNAVVIADNPMSCEPDQFFYDGQPMFQENVLAEVGAGEFYVDPSNTTQVWIGSNPSGHTVEGSARGTAIAMRSNGAKVRGIGVRRYAPTYSFHAPAYAGGSGQEWTDMHFEHNAQAGLFVRGAYTLVANSAFQDNGQMGLWMEAAALSTVRDSVFLRNNTERFEIGQAAGGVKIASQLGDSNLARFENNEFSDNHGFGLWADINTAELRIVNNLAQRNVAAGFYHEFSTEPQRTVIADNYSVDNGVGIQISEAGNVDVFHNTLINNGRSVVVQAGRRGGDERNYRIFNNEYSQDGTGTMMSVLDFSGEDRDFTEFLMDSGYNAFDKPVNLTELCRYVQRGEPDIVWPNVNECYYVTAAEGDAQEYNSQQVVNAADPREPIPGKMGAPLPANVATAMGRTAGQSYKVGAL